MATRKTTEAKETKTVKKVTSPAKRTTRKVKDLWPKEVETMAKKTKTAPKRTTRKSTPTPTEFEKIEKKLGDASLVHQIHAFMNKFKTDNFIINVSYIGEHGCVVTAIFTSAQGWPVEVCTIPVKLMTRVCRNGVHKLYFYKADEVDKIEAVKNFNEQV